MFIETIIEVTEETSAWELIRENMKALQSTRYASLFEQFHKDDFPKFKFYSENVLICAKRLDLVKFNRNRKRGPSGSRKTYWDPSNKVTCLRTILE